MIIEAFTFTYTRLRYLKVAVENITGFTPDAKPASFVTDLATQAKDALTAALAQKVKDGQTRGVLQLVLEPAHANTVMAHACMKSCYRTAPEQLTAIQRVPVDDKTPAQTLHRMKELSAVWTGLPSVPGTNKAFAVRGVTLASFKLQLADLDEKIDDYTQESVFLDNEEAKLRGLNATAEDFIRAALTQGRAQYAAGTPERAFIEAVPTEPSTQKPGQATFALAESPAEGAVHLQFDAERATNFQVWHKGPGEAQFTQVGESIRPGDYVAFGLSAGNHDYQVVGVNSRGEGAASEAASVSVAEAAVA